MAWILQAADLLPLLEGLPEFPSEKGRDGEIAEPSFIIFLLDFPAGEVQWDRSKRTQLQTPPGHPLHPPAAQELQEDPYLPCSPSLSCPGASAALHHPRCQPIFRENILFPAIKAGPVGVVCAEGHVPGAGEITAQEQECHRQLSKGGEATKH